MALAALLLAWARAVSATEVNLVGLFPDKALVEIDGGKAVVLSVGQRTPEGVKLISAGSAGAVLEIDGKRMSLQMGQSVSAKGASAGRQPTATLYADGNGHFFAQGTINGSPVRFLVDTGATTVAMSIAEARRLGINYLNGRLTGIATAAGVVPAYRVSLDAVKVGEISMSQIDAMVIDAPAMPFALLGMSFLSRVQMRREGTTLTLVRQY